MSIEKTLKASDLIKILEHSIKQYGDLDVMFTDGIGRSAITCFEEGAANFDRPKAMLIKARSAA